MTPTPGTNPDGTGPLPRVSTPGTDPSPNATTPPSVIPGGDSPQPGGGSYGPGGMNSSSSGCSVSTTGTNGGLGGLFLVGLGAFIGLRRRSNRSNKAGK